MLIPQSQQVLRDSERENLIRRAGDLSREVDSYLAGFRRQLTQLGTGLLLTPGPPVAADRLREPWVNGYLKSFLRQAEKQGTPAARSADVGSATGEGRGFARGDLNDDQWKAIQAALEAGAIDREARLRVRGHGAGRGAAGGSGRAGRRGAGRGTAARRRGALRFRPLEISARRGRTGRRRLPDDARRQDPRGGTARRTPMRDALLHQQDQLESFLRRAGCRHDPGVRHADPGRTQGGPGTGQRDRGERLGADRPEAAGGGLRARSTG